MTNFEQIKAMGVEELAELIDKHDIFGEHYCGRTCPNWSDDYACADKCKPAIINWLNSEVAE